MPQPKPGQVVLLCLLVLIVFVFLLVLKAGMEGLVERQIEPGRQISSPDVSPTPSEGGPR